MLKITDIEINKYIVLLFVFFISCNKGTPQNIKKSSQIIGDTSGFISTTIPSLRIRSSSSYNWLDRHKQILRLIKSNPPKVVFLGNSIFHYWGGVPITPKQESYRGLDSWNMYFKSLDAINMGFSGDRIENVLWRIYHGELDGFEASKVLILIGTNNIGVTHDSDRNILKGLTFLLNSVVRHQPDADIILMGLIPSMIYEDRVVSLNNKISLLCDTLGVRYENANFVFLNKDSTIKKELYHDRIHPNTTGYRLLAPVIASYLK